MICYYETLVGLLSWLCIQLSQLLVLSLVMSVVVWALFEGGLTLEDSGNEIGQVVVTL